MDTDNHEYSKREEELDLMGMTSPSAMSSTTTTNTRNVNGPSQPEYTAQYYEALERVRSIFVGQPIFRDLQGRRTAFFTVTDFLKPIYATLVEDMAVCMIEKLGGAKELQRQADVLVSLADRASGPLTHAVSRLTGIPYTLANWYPHGSPGEIEIEPCGGFSGEGLVFLNGLRNSHSKAVLLMDCLKTGTTAGNLIVGLQRHGIVVSHAAFATEILEANGRNSAALSGIPVTTLTSIHMRGECTKEGVAPGKAIPGSRLSTQRGGKQPGSTSPTTMSGVLRATTPTTNHTPRVALLGSPGNTGLQAAPTQLLSQNIINPIPRRLAPTIRTIKKMDPTEVSAKLDRVAATFLHVPIQRNPKLSYPYSFFTLTDFVPVMNPQLVEDMADLCVYYGDFERCDLVVSEADRGGGPLAQAVSMRVDRPFVLANWYQSGEGLGAASHVEVGFSGQGNIVVNGVQPGDRCTFVDDMLSSGGTAEGVLRSIEALGGIPVEGVFVSEKLYPPSPEAEARSGGPGTALPMRKGKKKLMSIWPYLEVTTVVQFVADGDRTTAPINQIG